MNRWISNGGYKVDIRIKDSIVTSAYTHQQVQKLGRIVCELRYL